MLNSTTSVSNNDSNEIPNTTRDSKSRAYNLVVKIHNQRHTNKGLVTDCDCITDFRAGIVQIGPKCAQYRIEFLNREKRTPGHTRKTGGPNTKRRLERKFIRSKLAFPENDSTRRDWSEKYDALVSEEYQAQRVRRGLWRAAA